jgi:hypothetical protein
MLALVFAVMAHFNPKWTTGEQDLLWQIPLTYFAVVTLVRVVAAPFWIHREVAERCDSLSDDLAAINNSRPRVTLTATWMRAPMCTKNAISVPGREEDYPTVLIVQVTNEPITRTPSSVAENVRAGVAFFDDQMMLHGHKAAWIEPRSEYGDRWMPYLSHDPVTIEPGATRTIALMHQYPDEARPGHASCHALVEDSCKKPKWQKRDLRMTVTPLRFVVRVETRWEVVELEGVISSEPGGHYTFKEGNLPIVRSLVAPRVVR